MIFMLKKTIIRIVIIADFIFSSVLFPQSYVFYLARGLQNLPEKGGILHALYTAIPKNEEILPFIENHKTANQDLFERFMIRYDPIMDASMVRKMVK